ncbi:MAG: hypothetical protein M1839_001214 [Geoglossum umbratile]|nr:MAG: hypothetical protein M1839_001214 [Geoglossum umbratile]
MLETDQRELKEISNLLHVITHRNKNQHRLAKWWKWFSMLRRSINHLRTELDGRDPLRTNMRMAYMRDILLHKCYRAFSNVVADSQFSAIGLVLVAILARVNRIIRAHGADAEPHAPALSTAFELRVDEDFGEAVARGDVQGDGGPGVGEESSGRVDLATTCGVASPGVEEPAASGASTPKPKRKKRKTGNAIDDLFSTIL